ncbi:MAG: phosphodiester glycosidase family protein [Chlamydiia bacterium]|nr:phosphodiester glycosidase family protein [Chlamydiia bacterium]
MFALHYENRGFVHLLTVEPENYIFKIGLAQNNGLGVETTSSMAKRLGAIAAINGGFFEDESGAYIGASAGSLKIAGTYFSTCRKERGVIGWNDGREPIIDRLSLKPSIDGHLVDKFNGQRNPNDVVLFSWPFHRHTLTQAGGVEYALSPDGKIIGISSSGNMKIPENGYVLSVGPTAHFPKFQLHSSVEIAFKASDAKWNSIDNIMDGTPVLIQNGRPVENYDTEKVIETFITKPHPRSAVGIKKNGDWVFVVAEGRRENFPGLTLQELTDLMLDLGCTDALNLDGGGSTTLFYDGLVRNTPADMNYKGIPKERPVANCILVFPKK